ncbi:molybdopterin synthase sulfur carrier subunit [Tatumella sp. TA1]|uniref:molybdopterin synthase sulfur carrier subunit n=1 Tax=Rosenbergiella collisarenosi TaxID=1544695 RepID=UPI0008F858EF|nr:molybdopterin synthase sulfur carrier subunit [Rosenbergiella collisarenosi]MBT0722120.1 molybdopterin synthase sulfur carrier subunit [Rosenbergiella collisarenosi]QGX91003.1 molybdopterin synthase sulfur carrier subunit [Tatumella sp. TA1]
MINVLFFAQTRELVDCSSLVVDDEVDDVEQLRVALMQRGKRWQLALSNGRLLAAVNQEICAFSHPLKSGDEVAFFPPVTGG